MDYMYMDPDVRCPQKGVLVHDCLVSMKQALGIKVKSEIYNNI